MNELSHPQVAFLQHQKHSHHYPCQLFPIRTGPFSHIYEWQLLREGLWDFTRLASTAFPVQGLERKQDLNKGHWVHSKSRWTNDSTHFTNEESKALRSLVNFPSQITWSSNWAVARWIWLALNCILFCICSSLKQLAIWAKEPEAPPFKDKFKLWK